MGTFETLIFELQGRVAHVTINRPEAMNAHNVAMKNDMFEVFGAIASDREIRAVVVKAAGDKAFCAGADLSEFLSAPAPTKARQIRLDRDLWETFTNMPQPLVAALHGYVLGSGIEIALCCDIRYASPEARFGLPEVGLGIIPAAGGTQTVPRAVGRGLAMDMILTNRWIDAEEAKSSGLVNRIVPRDMLWEEAEKAANSIAEMDPEISRSIKRAVNQGLDLPLERGLELEKRLAQKVWAA